MRPSIKALLLFHIRTCPYTVWMFLALSLFMCLPWLNWFMGLKGVPFDSSSPSLELVNFWSVYGLMAGFLFLHRNEDPARRASTSELAYGEFLLSRTISRRIAYFTRIALFFLIVLTPPALTTGAALQHPDLRFLVHQSEPQSTEASRNSEAYWTAFPTSMLTREKPNQVLVVPKGRIFVAVWNMWRFLMAALLLQMIGLGFLNRKVRSFLQFLAAMGPILIMVAVTGGEGLARECLEKAFFAFVEYGAFFAFGTFLAIGAVQAWAYLKIRKLEIS